MHRAVLVPIALALGLLAIVLWLALASAPEARTADATSELDRARSTSVAPVVLSDVHALEPEHPAPSPSAMRAELSAEDIRLETAASRVVPEREPPAQFHGRVFDERWQPLRGARVTLGAVGRPWREGTRVRTVEQGSARREGFEVRTDREGAFAISAPVTTALLLSLRVEHCRNHTVSLREFDAAYPAGLRHHLGEFVLFDAGQIVGRVRSSSGHAIEGAVIESTNWLPGGKRMSGSDGRFEFASMPTGDHKLRVHAPGHLRFEHTVAIDAGKPPFALEVELAAVHAFAVTGERVHGVVVDRGGRPVAGVILHASETWNSGGIQTGAGSKCTTGSDGRFAFEFSNPPRARIGFSEISTAWNGAADPELGKPGHELRLELPSYLRPEFVDTHDSLELLVLDDRSGAPVTLCAAELRPGEESDLERDRAHAESELAEFAELMRAPDGLLRLRTRPELDWLLCRAPGYASHRGPFVSDEQHGTRMTLRLVRESRVRGRVQEGAYAKVVLSGSRLSGRARAAICDGDGGFEFTELPSGSYALTIHTGDRAPWSTEEFELAAERTLELGELAFPPEPAPADSEVTATRWPKSGW